jgi:predicted helicase
VGLLKGVSPTGQPTGSYYEVDGQPLGEKKLWLNDDYVKFIRLAQWRIECSGMGIVGLVTNNGYLSNPTFRGMRQQLMRTFPRIEVIDLNGSTKSRRRVPEDLTDENVFQIQQGVAIAMMVRNAAPSSPAVVTHMDVWGLRKEKLAALESGGAGLVPLAPSSPYYFFFPWQAGGSADFDAFIKITDLMTTSTTGFITARDGLVVDFDAESLLDRIGEFRDTAYSDATIRSRFFGGRSEGRYSPGDTSVWKLSDARKKVAADIAWRTHAEPCIYRPFDTRQVYYAPWMVHRRRDEVFAHLLPAGTTRCLMVCRQAKSSSSWSHVLVANQIIDSTAVSNRSSEIGYAFPLSLRSASDGARPITNFTESAVRRFEETLGPRSQWPSRRGVAWSELLFDYTIAIMHSPDYRKRYLDMLQVDFPKIPVPGSLAAFQALSELGGQLSSAYLLEDSAPAGLAKFNGIDRQVAEVGEAGKTLRLASASASHGRLYINASSYFDAIPVASWELTIGAYQVCHKWLDDRRKSGRALADEEVSTFRAIVWACGRIIDLSVQVDEAVSRSGGWPGAFAAGFSIDE